MDKLPPVPPSAWSQQNTSILRKKNLSSASTSSPSLQPQQQTNHKHATNLKTNQESCISASDSTNRNNYDNVGTSRVPTSGVDAVITLTTPKLYEDDDKIEIHVNKDTRFDDFGFSIMDSVYGKRDFRKFTIFIRIQTVENILGKGIYVNKVRYQYQHQYLKPYTQIFKVRRKRFTNNSLEKMSHLVLFLYLKDQRHRYYKYELHASSKNNQTRTPIYQQ